METTRFAWKAGGFKTPAHEAAALFAALRDRDGELTRTAIVDAARPLDAPMHPDFEWQDDVAAEAYRQLQASHMIRSLVVVEVAEDGVERERREYVSLAVLQGASEEPLNGDVEGRYVTIEDVMADPAKRAAYVASVLAELERIRRKYEDVAELASVFVAIDRASAKRAKDSARAATTRSTATVAAAPAA